MPKTITPEPPNSGDADDLDIYKDKYLGDPTPPLPPHEPESHMEIASKQGCKYRTPYLFNKEDLHTDLHEETPKVIDMCGNEYETFNTTGWIESDEQGLMEMFADLNSFKENTGKVDWAKVDYEIFGEDWYREKYPNFPDEWYDLLVKASREKYKDLQKSNTKGLRVTPGDVTIKFD
tara:strand:- start:62 stop:592 length:531 start_codon:yes stop_codon:yes gene_type:complete